MCSSDLIALIVKIFGKNVGYHFLHSKLLGMWKPIGKMDFVDLGHDFFLIKFSVKEDHSKVLRGGSGSWEATTSLSATGNQISDRLRRTCPQWQSGFSSLSFLLSIMNP